MATLHVSPSRVRPSHTITLTFTGSGTHWRTVAPSLSVSGLAGVTIGDITVLSDTLATADVTYGPARGIATWLESNSGAVWSQHVTAIARWVPKR